MVPEILLACSTIVHIETLHALIQTESSYNPYAIAVVNDIPLAQQPKTLQEAELVIDELEAKKINYSVGLGQVNKGNFAKYGVTGKQLLDSCTNIKVSEKILSACYAKSPNKSVAEALSCYYAGNFSYGFVREGKYGITRLLENIQEDTENPNSLYSRLTIWKKGGIYGWVFDNENDQLSFDDRIIYGFDGTEILDNAAVINAIAYYLLYRVQQTLDGRRMVVFLDEFWKWLQGESFREFTFDGLKTMRKKNGFVVPITQSPSELLKSDIARAIIEQVETFIYLPNSKADRNEYINHFRVSEKEFDLITGLEDDSRMFLVKKGNENDNRGNTGIKKCLKVV
uniref:CagE protein n=1 Tax=Aggregatibacter actinomycetemcomitans TaxID=714 RepID=Q8KI83_AGGAC|nr:CagE protein [Aggregatibacter actinomycetemcomitans Y4]AAM68958.1 CagE protein [Aggregatibacter actinomycetemcomitans]AAM68959.1 CagE protein [Aggregatibacter actinomycetemcomitans HK1651]SCA78651.1 CagE [Aggregatibacter actinomycetemcomitans]